jgi:hypothetical protein
VTFRKTGRSKAVPQPYDPGQNVEQWDAEAEAMRLRQKALVIHLTIQTRTQSTRKLFASKSQRISSMIKCQHAPANVSP